MIGRPVTPKEHGAWAVLFVPMAIVAAVEERISVGFVILALTSLSVFLAYVPGQVLLRSALGPRQSDERTRIARSWITLYLLSAAFFGGVLLLQGFWLLVPIGLLGAVLFVLNFFLTRRSRKSVASDLSAVVGLTLTGPAASYVLVGVITAESLSLWLLTVLFFGSTVIYVHMKIHATGIRRGPLTWRDRLSMGHLNILYHVVVLGLVSVLVVNRFTPSLAILAFLPILVHSVIGTMRLSSRVSFKRLGFLLLGHSLLFGVLLGCIY